MPICTHDGLDRLWSVVLGERDNDHVEIDCNEEPGNLDSNVEVLKRSATVSAGTVKIAELLRPLEANA